MSGERAKDAVGYLWETGGRNLLPGQVEGCCAEKPPDSFGHFSAERCGCPGRMPPGRTRRAFLQNASMGFGWLALSGLLAEQSRGDTSAFSPHFPARAKHVIFLFMDGGVSHVDSFDPKPALEKHHDEKVGNWKATPKSQSVSPDRKWKRSPWAFRPHGQCGLPVSDLFPHIASCADDLCVVRSMVGETPL